VFFLCDDSALGAARKRKHLASFLPDGCPANPSASFTSQILRVLRLSDGCTRGKRIERFHLLFHLRWPPGSVFEYI